MPAESVYHVSADGLQAGFDGRGSLLFLLRSGGPFFIRHSSTGSSPWRLTLRDGKGGQHQVTTDHAVSFRAEAVGNGLRMQWLLGEPAHGVCVWVVITPDEDSLLWRLTVDGLTPRAALWEAEFPLLSGLCPLGDGAEERLLVPRAGGFVVHDPRQALFDGSDSTCGIELPYPGGLTMQLLAYYRQDAHGLLVFTQDPHGYYKRFSAQEETNGWALAVKHVPEDIPRTGGQCDLPYPVAVTTFSGDWNDAAARYRRWAIQQPWCRLGPLSTRTDLPSWLMDAGLWVWNRGTSARVLPGVQRLQQVVGAPLALDWYWWHATPYDTYFPDYLPPREGAESFRAAIAALHKEGHRAIVYINGRLWGTGAPSWQAKHAERAACKLEDGTIYREVYNVFNQAEMAAMCPTTALWQQTVRDLADELVNRYGLDGVYIDQVAIAAPRPCFDATHGHALGGGNHWCRGYRSLIQGVRQRVRERTDVFLPTEGSCETYLDLFDAFLVLDNSYERMGFYEKPALGKSAGSILAGGRSPRLPSWEPVPLFSAVYHDYAMQFGSYASFAPPPYDDLWPQPQGPLRSPLFDERDFADAFYAELGRAFVAGAQPMVSNVHPEQLDDPRLREHWQFVRDLVHTRLQARDILVHGRWLKPPVANTDSVAVSFLVRGVYTPPSAEHVVQRTMPAVLVSHWQAPDGHRGLALANISQEARRVVWQAEDMRPGLPVVRISGRGRENIGLVGTGGRVFAGLIPPRSVQVIEVETPRHP